MPTVLVIDDDRATLHLIREALRDTALDVETVDNPHDGLDRVARLHPELVLLDVMLPDISGPEAFQTIKRLDPRVPVIFITAGGTSDTAIEAMKDGAYDYLTKPLDLARLRQLVQEALGTRRLMCGPITLAGSPDGSPHGHEQDDCIVGRSPQILEVYKAVGRVAPQNVTVLIRGESGTGKELIARAIARHSERARLPFLAVNCAAIPDALLESELFGHEKGAFTGADHQRIGKFEQCSGGTIFLDEVGDMSPLVQGKLLRLLQNQQFERVGGNQTIKTDVRIIAATHRDLEAMSNAGLFRADLYYRLNGFTITVPPLRNRGDDVVLLIESCFGRFAKQLGKSVQGIAPDALKLLVEYPWPGNVRELQSTIRRALLETTGPVLVVEALPEEIRSPSKRDGQFAHTGPTNGTFEQMLESQLQVGSTDLYAAMLSGMETYLLTRVLRSTGGNQSQAAKILGITRGSLRHKIHALGIQIGNIVVLDQEPVEDPSATT